MKVRLIAVFLLLTSLSGMLIAGSVVEVVTVYNRPASEIEPLLMPLLESTDQVVANGDNMIVKTTPERLQTITNIIRKLDNPLNNLQITVIQSRDVTASQLNAGIGVDINIPLSHAVNPSGGVRGYYGQFQGRSNNQNIQTVRTLDGMPAQIKIGNVLPIATYQVYQDGYGYPLVNRSTQFIEATTGFEVTPSLVGQQVVLDVSPWSDRFNAQGQIQTQQANTSIRANLGEWVEIGGIDENCQGNTNGVFIYNRRSTQNYVRIIVKVDVVK